MNNLSRCIVLAAALVCTTAAEFGWGNATHVYIADHLGAKLPLQNTYELYGALLPDIYSYRFDEVGMQMHGTLHGTIGTMLTLAVKRDVKSAAFGFLSHNELYGADATAHQQAMTLPAKGYMVIKGDLLALELKPVLITVMTDKLVDPGMAAAVAEAIAPGSDHHQRQKEIAALLVNQQDLTGTDNEKLVGLAISFMAHRNPTPRK